MRVKALVVVVAAMLLVAASASAASPDVAAMNLQATDVPGARVVNQHAVNEPGFVAAHFRSFLFTKPNTGARLIGLESETVLAASAAKAAPFVGNQESFFRSKAGRRTFIAAIAKQTKVKLAAVTLGQPHAVQGFDQGFELATSVGVKGGRIYENLIVVRLDRVVVQMLESGSRPIPVSTTTKYTNAVAGHIATELAPVSVSPPIVSGTAQQGQTLTATPGAWSTTDETFAYQWQRCDAAGANCVDVPGATGSTYAVGAADAGSALRVVVTATNRFGSATGTSVPTAVVT